MYYFPSWFCWHNDKAWTRHGPSWFPLHNKLFYSCKTMSALLSSCQEQKKRGWTPVVLTSSFPVYTEIKAKDIQIFPCVPKYPLLSQHTRLWAIEFLSFPTTHENCLSIKQDPLRTTGLPTPALSPHQHKSATACAILFSHISSASADLQLTKDPAPVPSTSFICLRRHVNHSTLSSLSQCPWLYSFKELELTDALFSTLPIFLRSHHIGKIWIK